MWLVWFVFGNVVPGNDLFFGCFVGEVILFQKEHLLNIDNNFSKLDSAFMKI